MNDLISRKELLQELDKVMAQYNWKDDGIVMDTLTCVRDMIADQPKVDEWIPCSFAYPPISQDEFGAYWSEPVLVTYLSSGDKTPMDDHMAVYNADNDCWYWYNATDDDPYESVRVDIVAWMTRPEPYQSVDGNEMVGKEEL